MVADREAEGRHGATTWRQGVVPGRDSHASRGLHTPELEQRLAEFYEKFAPDNERKTGKAPAEVAKLIAKHWVHDVPVRQRVCQRHIDWP